MQRAGSRGGQQAKREDVKTFKRRLRNVREMFEYKEGARALLADPPGASACAPLFPIFFRALFFQILMNCGTHWGPTFDDFLCFCITFPSMDFPTISEYILVFV